MSIFNGFIWLVAAISLLFLDEGDDPMFLVAIALSGFWFGIAAIIKEIKESRKSA